MDIRHVSKVYTKAIFTKFPLKLSHSLEEREGLNVSHHSTNFCENKIVIFFLTKEFYIPFDLVRDMGDYLNGLTQIVTSTLLTDYILIDTPRGYVIGTRGRHVQESLVMPQVQIGLMPIVGHIALPVLVGIECTRVYIDIGIKLLNRYLKPSSL